MLFSKSFLVAAMGAAAALVSSTTATPVEALCKTCADSDGKCAGLQTELDWSSTRTSKTDTGVVETRWRYKAPTGTIRVLKEHKPHARHTFLTFTNEGNDMYVLDVQERDGGNDRYYVRESCVIKFKNTRVSGVILLGGNV